jgi:hypothetical protein
MGVLLARVTCRLALSCAPLVVAAEPALAQAPASGTRVTEGSRVRVTPAHGTPGSAEGVRWEAQILRIAAGAVSGAVIGLTHDGSFISGRQLGVIAGGILGTGGALAGAMIGASISSDVWHDVPRERWGRALSITPTFGGRATGLAVQWRW